MTITRVAFVCISLAGLGQAFVVPRHHAGVDTPSMTMSAQGQILRSTISALNLLDPQAAMDVSSGVASLLQDLPSHLMAFTDQGQNLAGIFFQGSLLPYLLFLYFLSFRGNQIPALGNYGFQFVLLFVISTIPSGIISKTVYGYSLADTDYLHGGAELLLTVANILICLGFKEAMSKSTLDPISKPRNVSLGIAAGFAALCVLGPTILEGHTPFLFGLGNIPADQVVFFPWVNHPEPDNALSIPTWAIHFSSVFEYLFAMNLVWKFAETTGNEKWKGLTWGMLPLHASGICACTYHFFYNNPSLQFLVTSQAGLTLVGNITLMLAAFRIAQSNGWSPQELIPTPNRNTSPQGLVADGLAMKPLILTEGKVQSNSELALNLAAATIFTSYFVKYGELALDLPFSGNPFVALSMIIGFPGMTAYYYYNKSKSEGQEWKLPSLSLPGQGDQDGPSLSMDDIKKYGVAGTVAYVLTELAFWFVAFPVAAVALYQSTGHWPDVINDTTDRAAVLAFIFAGANIARAFVPLRLGAALALAPWVDENILARMQKDSDTEEEGAAVDVKSVAVEDPKTLMTPRPPSPPSSPVQKASAPEEPRPIPPTPPATEPKVSKLAVSSEPEAKKEKAPPTPKPKAPSVPGANIFASMKSIFPEYVTPSAPPPATKKSEPQTTKPPSVAAVEAKKEPAASNSEKVVEPVSKPATTTPIGDDATNASKATAPSPAAAPSQPQVDVVNGQQDVPIEVVGTDDTSLPYFMRTTDE